MPIVYRIDHANRIVWVRGAGELNEADFFGYQQEVWSRADVVGYNELMDMSEVEGFVLPSTTNLRELAVVSSAMDVGSVETKFAIVAPQDVAFGLGRMYETYRELMGGSAKQVGVFRTMPEALAFLGLEHLGRVALPP